MTSESDPHKAVSRTITHQPGRDRPSSSRHRLQNSDDDARSSWPEASHAAVTLWRLAARDRTARGKVLAADRSEQLISIDGTPKPFLTLTAATGHWIAVRHHNDLTITIAASDLDCTPITIEPISDPAARLLGARPTGAAVWPEWPDPGA